MPFAAGVRLGPYEIGSPLGAGGMGEVYRARDPRLGRNVAIKILPETFGTDPERLARFQREAQVLASLNHPHIAAIYGIEESGGARALVLELVEGPTLADRIAQGPVPLDDALPIAKQIAEALECAHENGIIHRDLKPANVKIRPDGTVKVLDFGLAKALDPPVTTQAAPALSPTITSPAMTRVGVVLGTAAYMSPEQARGKSVDRRADIWAFGCVLFEMLSGRRPFDGDTVSDSIAATLRADPDWRALPASTPGPIRTLLRRCLEKDPGKRLPHIGLARLEIAEAPHAGFDVATAGAARKRLQPLGRRALPLVLTALAAGGAAAGTVWTLNRGEPHPTTRFSLVLPPDQRFTGFSNAKKLAWSPDGTHIVYVLNDRLYARPTSSLKASVIPGSEAAAAYNNPVLSPDGKTVAFWSRADGKIKRIPLGGGVAETVCEATNPGGMSWHGEAIVFSQGSRGIMRVEAKGGTPDTIARVETGEYAHGGQLLADGDTLLFTIAPSGPAGPEWEKSRVVAESLSAGDRRTLVTGATDAVYASSGHLLYSHGGILLAAPFDAKRRALTGPGLPVLEGIRRGVDGSSAQYVVSQNGSLAYIPGPATTKTTQTVNVGLFPREGGLRLLKMTEGSYRAPRAAPDGKQVAFVVDDGGSANVWVYELSGSSAMRRLTFEGRNRHPVWSPDSQWITFQSDRERDVAIFRQRADGTGTAERLTKPAPAVFHVPDSWSPDGTRLLFTEVRNHVATLWTWSVKDGATTRFSTVASTSSLPGASFSPDGRWVAYTSRVSADVRSAVYVEPFPPTGAKYQVSKNTEDGHHAVWSRDGTELFYTPGPGRTITRLRVASRPAFSAADERVLPREFLNLPPNTERPYDTLPGTGDFLATIDTGALQAGAVGNDEIHVVLNWFEELHAKVPIE
jgi:serine/threonine-protein kinase